MHISLPRNRIYSGAKKRTRNKAHLMWHAKIVSEECYTYIYDYISTTAVNKYATRLVWHAIKCAARNWQDWRHRGRWRWQQWRHFSFYPRLQWLIRQCQLPARHHVAHILSQIDALVWMHCSADVASLCHGPRHSSRQFELCHKVVATL